MLSKELLDALKGYTARMTNTVTLVVQTGEHDKRAELLDFLTLFASASDRIQVAEGDRSLRSPISFTLETEGRATGIVFSGIPGGHEFNSLVLAVLQAAGTDIKLDDAIKQVIAAVEQPLRFEVFVSLSCHNCPDVVQSLNQFALLNEHVSSEMIDGALFQPVIDERNIQGVPTVYLNGELFANGKIDTAQLLEKLMANMPSLAARARPAEALPRQDITVIGGGPAGVAAAVYAARKGLSVTLVADRLGGQVKDTQGIENLISVPKTTGPALTRNLAEHLADYAVTLREHQRVERIEQGPVKRLHLTSGEVIDSRALIVATGAKWRELNVPGEKENIGSGVAYCPHCDGPFFKGRDVAVIGGGNSGIEAALDLAGIVSKVTVFEFMPELKADQVLVDQARGRDNIEIRTNVAVKAVIADNGKVTGLDFEDRKSGERGREALDGVFVQIGLVPNSAFLADLVERTDCDEVKIDERGRTSAAGIFACGDVTTVPYKQIVVAMGEGAKAALAAFEYLLSWEETQAPVAA